MECVAVRYLDETDEWGVFEYDNYRDMFKDDWHWYGPRIALHNAIRYLCPVLRNRYVRRVV